MFNRLSRSLRNSDNASTTSNNSTTAMSHTSSSSSSSSSSATNSFVNSIGSFIHLPSSSHTRSPSLITPTTTNHHHNNKNNNILRPQTAAGIIGNHPHRRNNHTHNYNNPFSSVLHSKSNQNTNPHSHSITHGQLQSKEEILSEAVTILQTKYGSTSNPAVMRDLYEAFDKLQRLVNTVEEKAKMQHKEVENRYEKKLNKNRQDRKSQHQMLEHQKSLKLQNVYMRFNQHSKTAHLSSKPFQPNPTNKNTPSTRSHSRPSVIRPSNNHNTTTTVNVHQISGGNDHLTALMQAYGGATPSTANASAMSANNNGNNDGNHNGRNRRGGGNGLLRSSRITPRNIPPLRKRNY